MTDFIRYTGEMNTVLVVQYIVLDSRMLRELNRISLYESNKQVPVKD